MAVLRAAWKAGSKAGHWDMHSADYLAAVKAVKMVKWSAARKAVQTAEWMAAWKVAGSVDWRAVKRADHWVDSTVAKSA